MFWTFAGPSFTSKTLRSSEISAGHEPTSRKLLEIPPSPSSLTASTERQSSEFSPDSPMLELPPAIADVPTAAPTTCSAECGASWGSEFSVSTVSGSASSLGVRLVSLLRRMYFISEPALLFNSSSLAFFFLRFSAPLGCTLFICMQASCKCQYIQIVREGS